MVKYCPHCHDTDDTQTGYFWCWKKTDDKCPICQSEWEDLDFNVNDLCILQAYLKSSKKFIDAMVNLYQTDIIAYEEKMSQFRMEIEQKRALQKQNSSTPRCPHCKSTNIAKIGAGERIGSIAVMGIFSKKINKSFKCKNCGYTW